jgi:hypothetical protein
MKVKPGFDPEKLIEHGFNDTLNYFTGTRFNISVVGWAGHERNGSGNLLFLGCWLSYVGIGVSSVGLA